METGGGGWGGGGPGPSLDSGVLGSGMASRVLGSRHAPLSRPLEELSRVSRWCRGVREKASQ